MKLTKEKAALVKRLKAKVGNVVTRKEVLQATKGSKRMPRWLFNTKTYRGKARGTYDLNKVEKFAQPA